MEKEYDYNDELTENTPDTEEAVMPWEDILSLTNGVDVSGVPLASGTLAREEAYDEKNVKILQNAMLDEAVFYIRVSGGCAAMYIDFPLQCKQVFENAKQICQQWLNELGNPEYDHQYFTLTVVPLLLEGKAFLIFNHLILADGYSTEQGHRLILAFDNLQTLPVRATNTNFERMIAEINAELQREENELLDSIAEAEAIQREAEAYNPFDDEFKEHFSKMDFSEEEETEDIENPRVRYKEVQPNEEE